MPDYRSTHVRFAHPAVNSFSRKPTQNEYLHINLLENHADRCMMCEPLLRNRVPSKCRRGEILEGLVLGHFVARRDGYIYSKRKERQCLVRVEMASHYWAVFALLQQVDGWRVRGSPDHM